MSFMTLLQHIKSEFADFMSIISQPRALPSFFENVFRLR